MATVQAPLYPSEEIADFFASRPEAGQILKFSFSSRIQQRARELLQRNREGTLTVEEQDELDDYVHADDLMRLVKAKIRASQANQP